MGKRNYLIEGVSCAGKTTLCDELLKRGYQAIHGDRVLAYQGDPKTGLPTQTSDHQHHIWNIQKVKELALNTKEPITFFCGGSRNFNQFIDLFDEVFVLDLDQETLIQRLNQRPEGEWGAKEEEKQLVLHLHQTKEDLPQNAIIIDATQSIEDVANSILNYINGIKIE